MAAYGCTRCGTEMVRSIENQPFRAPGRSVTMIGVVVHRCTCGDSETSIPRVDDLLMAMAAAPRATAFLFDHVARKWFHQP